MPVLTPTDWLSLLHPVLMILFVYPVVGATIRLGTLARERRLDINPLPPTVGVEHAEHGRWAATGVVVAILFALLVSFLRADLDPAAAVSLGVGRLLALVAAAAIALGACLALWRAQRPALRALLALSSWGALLLIGGQPEVEPDHRQPPAGRLLALSLLERHPALRSAAVCRGGPAGDPALPGHAPPARGCRLSGGPAAGGAGHHGLPRPAGHEAGGLRAGARKSIAEPLQPALQSCRTAWWSSCWADSSVGARMSWWRSWAAPGKPWQVQPMCLRAISNPFSPRASTRAARCSAASWIRSRGPGTGGTGRPRRAASMRPTSQGAPMVPRPTITPSAPVTSRQRRASSGLVMSPLAITGIARACFTRPIAAPVGPAAEALLPGAPVQGQGPGAGVLQQPGEAHRIRVVLAPAQAGLDGDRDGHRRRHRLHDPGRQVGSADQAAAAPLAGHLAHRAAHVDVDQEGPLRLGPPGRFRHGRRPVVEQLHRHRPRLLPHQLQLGVAMAQLQAGGVDHLGVEQGVGGPAPHQAPEDPVTHPGQGRLEHPAGQGPAAARARQGEGSGGGRVCHGSARDCHGRRLSRWPGRCRRR